MRVLFTFAAGALLTTFAVAAENPIAGKWTCRNIMPSGEMSPWTLIIKEEAKGLSGVLTDGQAEIPLSALKHAGGTLTFGFDINAKPYSFEGKADRRNLEGKYSGEEAHGTLRCTKLPAE